MVGCGGKDGTRGGGRGPEGEVNFSKVISFRGGGCKFKGGGRWLDLYLSLP